jgi:Mor family transcriptional regulator
MIWRLVLDEWMKELTLNELDEKNKEIAKIIGIDNLLLLCEYFGGTRLYVNKLDHVTAVLRNKKIKEEYNGYNSQQMVRKYNLTENQIQRILNEK